MKYIKGFDTLRALSIIFVILTHLGLYAVLPDDNFIKKRVWHLISGTTGVRIFFTLSGFLITKILLNELKKYNNINFYNFFARRFIRLLPPLIVFYILVSTLMFLNIIPANHIALVYSIFYAYNFVPRAYYTGELGHTWSLALEEQYYLIWPLIINFIRNKIVLFGIIFLILLACIYPNSVYPNSLFTENFKTSRWFIPAVGPIIIGSFFSLLINIEKWEIYFKKNHITIVLGILLFLFPLYSAYLKFSSLYQSAGIALILIWISFNQESKLTRLLDNKVLSYIGKISYGLYVYQGLFLTTGPAGNIWLQQFPQNIILTIVTAILSYHLLEKPTLKLKKRFVRNTINKELPKDTE